MFQLVRAENVDRDEARYLDGWFAIVNDQGVWAYASNLSDAIHILKHRCGGDEAEINMALDNFGREVGEE